MWSIGPFITPILVLVLITSAERAIGVPLFTVFLFWWFWQIISLRTAQLWFLLLASTVVGSVWGVSVSVVGGIYTLCLLVHSLSTTWEGWVSRVIDAIGILSCCLGLFWFAGGRLSWLTGFYLGIGIVVLLLRSMRIRAKHRL